MIRNVINFVVVNSVNLILVDFVNTNFNQDLIYIKTIVFVHMIIVMDFNVDFVFVMEGNSHKAKIGIHYD